jgi:hypothetical protein
VSVSIKLQDYYNQTVTATSDVTFVEVSVVSVEGGTNAKVLTDPSLFHDGKLLKIEKCLPFIGLANPTIQLIGTMSKSFILVATTDAYVVPLNISVIVSKCGIGEMSTAWDSEFSNCQECPIGIVYHINL